MTELESETLEPGEFTFESLENHSLRDGAQLALGHPWVTHADVVELRDGETAVELVVMPPCDKHIPPSLCSILADAGLSIHDVTPRQSPRHFIVTCS